MLTAWAALASARCGSAPSPEEVLHRLNAERVRGVACRGAFAATTPPPLRWSTGLASVAAAQADDMLALRKMGHRDLQNRPLSARLQAAGYRFGIAVENVAVGHASLDSVVDAWLASDAHCANLMNAAVLEVGLVCSDGGGNAADRYWSLVLAAPPRR